MVVVEVPQPDIAVSMPPRSMPIVSPIPAINPPIPPKKPSNVCAKNMTTAENALIMASTRPITILMVPVLIFSHAARKFGVSPVMIAVTASTMACTMPVITWIMPVTT